jgi:hypothetical protein
MKLQNAKFAVLCVRCAHRDCSGRQCRLFVSDAHSGLCPQHYTEQKQKESANVSETLFKYSQAFQTAQGINHSLRNLFLLTSQNRISTRRAAVLAYIGSLLLRTLPAIDADRAAGIIDPTAPKKVSIPDPDPSQKPS